jgi:hypothetical protein
MVTKEEILKLLDENDRAVERAVLVIYENQTREEQGVNATVEENGIGFTGADAFILSKFAQWLLKGKGNHLSPRQLEIAAPKMKKYWRQLLVAAKEKEERNASINT